MSDSDTSASSSGSSSGSDSEPRSKRHRSSRKRSRSPKRDGHRHSKSKSSKKEKKHHDRHKKSSFKKKHKSSHKKSKIAKIPIGKPVGKPPATLISKADYFTKSAEFHVYLRQHKRTTFEDLSSKDTHHMFKRFVEKWNKGDLEAMYYDGIPADLLEQSRRTTHKWGISLTGDDKMKLQAVKQQTGAPESVRMGPAGIGAGAGVGAGAGAGGSGRPHLSDREAERDRRRAERRFDNKRMRDRERVAIDELAPKPTPGSREARLEKRKATGAKIQGAARDKEAMADGLDLDDSTLMGSSGRSEFEREKQRIHDRRARWEAKKAERGAALQQAEQAKMQALLSDIGYTPGTKVTIRPRE